MKNKKINQMFLMDLNTYLEIVELAKKRGKKAEDNMTSEFQEIIKKKADKINFLGNTNLDVDMITGNLREKGLKIFNMKEEERKKRRKKWRN